MNQKIKINWQFGDTSKLAKYNGFHTIQDEVIYLSGGDHKNATLYSIDANNGQENWSFIPNNSDVFTFPTIYENNIYWLSIFRGTLLSLNISTGSLNWEAKIEKSNISFCSVSSPLAVNEIIYVGSNNGYLYGFDSNTGQTIRNIKITENSIIHSPVIANDGQTICVETSDGSLYAIDLATQKQKWKYTSQQTTINFDRSPVIDNGIVYSGKGRTTFLALDFESGEELWNFKPEFSQALTSPAISDNVICLGDNNGNLWGIQSDNGQIIWSYSIKTAWNNISFGWIDTPVIINGIVYVGGRGYLRALTLQTGKELWKYEAPSFETFSLKPSNLVSKIINQLSKTFLDEPYSEFFSPLIVNDLIYVVAKNGASQSLLSLTLPLTN